MVLNGSHETFIMDENNSAQNNQERKSILVINPSKKFYLMWQTFVTFCVLYNIWTIIARQAFQQVQENWRPLWYTADVVADLIYLLDIVLNMHVGYMKDGVLIRNRKELAFHYIRSPGFALDLASVFPLDVIQLIRWEENPLWRFPRFIKLYRSYKYYCVMEKRISFSNIWRLINLMHVYLLIIHWHGCVFFLMKEKNEIIWDYGSEVTWKTYLTVFYGSAVSLSLSGHMKPQSQTISEYLFCLSGPLIGIFMLALIIGQICIIFINRNSNIMLEHFLDGVNSSQKRKLLLTSLIKALQSEEVRKSSIDKAILTEERQQLNSIPLQEFQDYEIQNQSIPKDGISAFCKQVGAKLRYMKLHQRESAQMAIESVLFKYLYNDQMDYDPPRAY